MLLIIFTTRFILDAWQASEYASGLGCAKIKVVSVEKTE